jgi:hypothetical protein
VSVLGRRQDEQLAVFNERVSSFTAWGFTLAQARALAASECPKSEVRRLVRKDVDRALIVRICA